MKPLLTILLAASLLCGCASQSPRFVILTPNTPLMEYETTDGTMRYVSTNFIAVESLPSDWFKTQ